MPPYCTSDEQIDRAFEVITTFLKNADRESQDVA
jgi:adenosylmethionine-8-amino-7-oxononanoate aminotransferase